MQADLALRDIHLPPPPPWWPPAPGWWVVSALLLIILVVLGGWSLHRRRRHAAVARLFDEALAAAASPAEQVARTVELLRRAAIRRDPASAVLQGEPWLALLAADSDAPPFDGAAARVLLEGAYRPDTTTAEAESLRGPARARFLRWMGAAR